MAKAAANCALAAGVKRNGGVACERNNVALVCDNIQ